MHELVRAHASEVPAPPSCHAPRPVPPELDRAVMRALEGGCSVPIGVETKWVDGKLRFRATVVSLRGDEGVDSEMTEEIKTQEEADTFGKKVAKDLVDRGASKILDAINEKRQVPETVK